MIIEYPLLRCPDCNQKPVITTDSDRGHTVQCRTCGPVLGFHSSIERAVREWNMAIKEVNLLLERKE